MYGNSRMIAVLLLVAIGVALSGAQASKVPAGRAIRPAGCHNPKPAIPSPAPANHQCCVNGHHAATPSASFSPQTLVQLGCGLEDRVSLRVDFAFSPSSLFIVPSDSPPAATQLRV